MNTPEIKAGQRWRFPRDGLSKSIWDGSSCVSEVKLVDDDFVYLRDTKKLEGYVVTASYFQEYYEPIPEPKTRPITKEDILKMLAVNPVLFWRIDGSDWEMCTRPDSGSDEDIVGMQFSHNPFAANPIVVGPEIEVKE